jgi:pimeloyl-ACP methyl ester carboxylesterase
VARGYSEELVWIESEDGIRLDGVVIRPVDGPIKPLAVVQVHGAGMRFSHPVHVRNGRGLAGHGYVSITGNNRGFAFGDYMRRRGSGKLDLVGNGWERFADCLLDVGPWVTFAAELGVRGVVLLGHSYGGAKAVHYQARRQDPRVVGLICASPGLVGWWPPDPDLLARAERLVAEGRGQDLLPWGSLGRDFTLSAQSFLDRAPTNQAVYDVFGAVTPDPAIGRIRCPILAFYGTEEQASGGVGNAELDLIRRNATAARRVDTALIEGGDHFYAGREQEVAKIVAGWIDRLLREPPGVEA